MSSFGSRELVACLTRLGFKEQPQTGSRHLKYSSPRTVKKGERPFITVLQSKASYDPVISKKYIKQIVKLGFTEKEISECGLE